MTYYYCDACRYCFEAEKLPERCPDCGVKLHHDKPAIRPATDVEVKELLRIRAEDND